MPFLNMPKSKTASLLAIALLAATPSSLVAAPKISSISLSETGSMVVKGNAFGQGPTVALYDDFSKASLSGGSVTFSPQVGRWLFGESDSNNLFVDEKHGSSGLFVRGNGSSRFIFGIADAAGPRGLVPFQEVYMSYTVRDFGDFPGTGGSLTNFSTQSATKDAWMMLGDRGDNTQYAVSQGEPSGHDLYVPAWTGAGFNIAGNNTQMEPVFWQGQFTNNWSFGGWNTSMFHAELDASDPYGQAEGFFSFLNKYGYFSNVRNGNFMEDQRSEGVPYASWDRIKFFSWMNTGDADVKRVVDEIYVAIGENSNARLLISDNEILRSSTRVFHLPPVSWTESEIVANLPEYLPTTNNYFLHVVDANNDESAGFALCQLCPTPPQVIEVQ